MFDLNRELQQWRQDMASADLPPDVLIELEEHLREDVAQQLRSGAEESAAFEVALLRIGKPTALKREFALVRPPSVMATLRRHKSKIVLCSALGLVFAIVLPLLRPALYQTETKLFIRYRPADERSSKRELDAVMKQQVQLLTSRDLATRVTAAVGADTILDQAAGRNDPIRAAVIIQRGLDVTTPGGTSEIRVAFRHPDPAVLEKVLQEVIDQFLRMQVELHVASGRAPFENGQITNVSLTKIPSSPLFDYVSLIRLQALAVGAGVLAGFMWVFAVRSNEDVLEPAD